MPEKSAGERRIDTAIKWYNIGVEDGRRWEARDHDKVVEIDEAGDIQRKVKLNILRDPEGEYSISKNQ